MSKPKSTAATPETPPAILDGDEYALAYWHQHAEALARADLLSPQDVQSFAMLCKVYSRLVRWEQLLDKEPKLVRAWLDCQAKYITMAKQFCLLPVQRKKSSVAFGDTLSRHDDKGDFDL